MTKKKKGETKAKGKAIKQKDVKKTETQNVVQELGKLGFRQGSDRDRLAQICADHAKKGGITTKDAKIAAGIPLEKSLGEIRVLKEQGKKTGLFTFDKNPENPRLWVLQMKK
jgi:hypothetical protein